MMLGVIPPVAFAQSQPPIPNEAQVPIALLVDVTNDQVLFAREESRRFVPASITKVMTLYHAFELIDEGQLDPQQQFKMNPDTWSKWFRKGSTMFIEAEDQVLVGDLLMGIANVSANDGSIALAEGQAGSVGEWLDAMNARARTLGMHDSHFGTPNGWPDEGRTFTNAQDLVKLAKAIAIQHPQKYALYIGQPGFRYNNIAQDNRDPLIGRIEGADGIKTGYTNEAGLGYVGSAKRGERRLVVVVAGASRNSTRAEAAGGLIEWGFNAFERVKVASAGQTVGAARVQNGRIRRLALETAESAFLNVPIEHQGRFETSIAYNGPLRAPISAGDRVATLLVQVPGSEPARIPLLAAQSVEKADFLTRIWNGIAGWFS
jgi:serine-type D-Ala-D-Ala carboxypeptidase (penicillin-binding protein 5/6)